MCAYKGTYGCPVARNGKICGPGVGAGRAQVCAERVISRWRTNFRHCISDVRHQVRVLKNSFVKCFSAIISGKCTFGGGE